MPSHDVEIESSLSHRGIASRLRTALRQIANLVGHYRKALELDGRNMMALNNLAYILLEYANQPDEGLMFAQKAAEVAPDSPVVQDTLGWAFYRKGMYADALKYLERAASKQRLVRRIRG